MNTSHAAPIQVAVVGHTNTGKTSLVRTLLRSKSFGAVNDSAGTTRHVERASLLADGKHVLSLYDTPGLEDSLGLLAALSSNERKLSVTRLQSFIDEAGKHPGFDQEIKVLRQAGQSDLLLYVVDVRARRLEKFSAELDILASLGKPIIPVFNFIVGQTDQLRQWRDMTVSHNLHAALEFDTVAFDFEAEKRLYQKMQSVLESRYDDLQRLIDHRSSEWQALCEAAVQRSQTLLIDAAILQVDVVDGGREAALSSLRGKARQLEQRGLHDLLKLFAFSRQDIELAQLPVSDGQWELDLFSVNTLRMFGLDARSSALKGAAAGAGLDLMVGGISLGAAAAAGALLGAGVSTFRRYGKRITSALSSQDSICLDDTSMSLLLLRQLDLLRRLTHRGHAAQGQMELSTMDDKQQHPLPEQWPSILAGLRTGLANRSASNSQFQSAKAELFAVLTKTSFSTS